MVKMRIIIRYNWRIITSEQRDTMRWVQIVVTTVTISNIAINVSQLIAVRLSLRKLRRASDGRALRFMIPLCRRTIMEDPLSTTIHRTIRTPRRLENNSPHLPRRFHLSPFLSLSLSPFFRFSYACYKTHPRFQDGRRSAGVARVICHSATM